MDYPPGYLYVLWGIGKLSSSPSYLLLKLPAIVADLAIAWVAGVFALRLAPVRIRERWPVRALVAAAVLFNPAVIALSAVWGQVDVVPALFVLLSLMLFFTGPRSLRRELAASLLFGVAIAIKPQSGLALPVILYALYQAHLHGAVGRALCPGSLTILASMTLTFAVWVGSGVAFGLGPAALYRLISRTAAESPVTSTTRSTSGAPLAARSTTGTRTWPPSFRSTTSASARSCSSSPRRRSSGGRTVRSRAVADRAQMLTFAAAITSLLGYTLLTRMHERYMFVALPLLAPLIFCRQLRFAYWALSTVFILDLWFAFAYANVSLPVPVQGLKLRAGVRVGLRRLSVRHLAEADDLGSVHAARSHRRVAGVRVAAGDTRPKPCGATSPH